MNTAYFEYLVPFRIYLTTSLDLTMTEKCVGHSYGQQYKSERLKALASYR